MPFKELEVQIKIGLRDVRRGVGRAEHLFEELEEAKRDAARVLRRDFELGGIDGIARTITTVGVLQGAFFTATAAALSFSAIAGAAILAVGASAAGAAAGVAALGTVAALQSEEVRRTFGDLGAEFVDIAADIADPVEAALISIAERALGTARVVRDEVAGAFEFIAPVMRRFSSIAATIAAQSAPALVEILQRTSPIIDVLADHFVRLSSTALNAGLVISSAFDAAAPGIDAFLIAVEKLTTRLADFLATVTTGGLDAMTAFLNAFNALADVILDVSETAIVTFGDELSTLINSFAGFINIMNKVAGSTAALLGILASMSAVLGGLGTILPRVGTTLSFFAGTFGTVITAMLALGAVVAAVIKNFESIISFIEARWPEVAEIIVGTVEGIQASIGPVLEIIRNAFVSVVSVVIATWSELFDTINDIAGQAGGDIATTTQNIKNSTVSAFQIIADIVEGTMRVIGSTIRLALNLIASDWEGTLQSLIDLTAALFGQTVNVFISKLQDILNSLGLFVKSVNALFSGLFLPFGEALLSASVRLGQFRKDVSNTDSVVAAFTDTMRRLSESFDFEVPDLIDEDREVDPQDVPIHINFEDVPEVDIPLPELTELEEIDLTFPELEIPDVGSVDDLTNKIRALEDQFSRTGDARERQRLGERIRQLKEVRKGLTSILNVQKEIPTVFERFAENMRNFEFVAIRAVRNVGGAVGELIGSLLGAQNEIRSLGDFFTELGDIAINIIEQIIAKLVAAGLAAIGLGKAINAAANAASGEGGGGLLGDITDALSGLVGGLVGGGGRFPIPRSFPQPVGGGFGPPSAPFARPMAIEIIPAVVPGGDLHLSGQIVTRRRNRVGR